jgi:hypothetical protein
VSKVVGSGVRADNSIRLVNISQQVLDTLRNSNIIEKRTNDHRAQFWAAYQKVAAEYDSEFLERHDGDMDIVLIFLSRTLNALLLADGLS